MEFVREEKKKNPKIALVLLHLIIERDTFSLGALRKSSALRRGKRADAPMLALALERGSETMKKKTHGCCVYI